MESDTATTVAILLSVSVGHLLNDMNQPFVPTIYPILKQSCRLLTMHRDGIQLAAAVGRLPGAKEWP
ncbi:hypothetical protein [Rhodopila sp.]|uniref:hypothetical protein n=1 Tax=Rhodopila sp. TaxID=2480087 RepID=UPI003D134EA3